MMTGPIKKDERIVDDHSDTVADLYEIMRAMSALGKIHADAFKNVYGDKWQDYDTHGYVQSFSDRRFIF